MKVLAFEVEIKDNINGRIAPMIECGATIGVPLRLTSLSVPEVVIIQRFSRLAKALSHFV